MADSSFQAEFLELRKAVKAEDFPKALALASALLVSLPEDHDVAKCKCVSLIHLSRFDAALAVATKENAGRYAASLSFERAYCLYQTGRLDEALSIVKNSDRSDGSANLQTLEAQILFRLGRTSEAADRYQELVDNDEDDDDGEEDGSELVSNALAAYTASGRGAEGIDKLGIRLAGLLREDADQSHEVAYNAACAKLDAGDYAGAAADLKVAQDRCAREDGDAAEAAAISVQRGLALLKSGGPGSAGAAQAMRYFLDVLKGKSGDDQVTAVAACNLAVVRRDRELFDSLKRLKAASAADATAGGKAVSKLTPAQQFACGLNVCLLLFHMGKLDESAAAAKALEAATEAAGEPSVAPALVQLAIKLRQPSLSTEGRTAVVAEALALSKDRAAAGDERGAAEAGCFAAECLMQRGDAAGATAALAAVQGGLLLTPGGAATLFDMRERYLRDGAGALAGLDTALAEASDAARAPKRTGQLSPDAHGLARLVMGVAKIKVAKGQFVEAAALYERLLAEGGAGLSDAERLDATAQLVLALSWEDPEQAMALAASLPKSNAAVKREAESEDEDEDDGIDPEALEAADLPKSNRVRRLVADKAAAKAEKKKIETPEALSAAAKRRRAKRKAAHLKKLLDLGKYDPKRPVQPDPERWLAKQMRSSFRRKRGKGAGKFSGAQGGGGDSKDAAKLDAYARAQQKKEADARAAEEPAGKGKRGPWRRLK